MFGRKALIFVSLVHSVRHSVSTSPSQSPWTSPLPSQQPLPPKQSWCPSEIFCAGSLLQTINVADLYPDQKSIVDRPTKQPPGDVLAHFSALDLTTISRKEVQEFVDGHFRDQGPELEPVTLENFKENPKFLDNVSDPLVKSFSRTVHGYWTRLIRKSNSSALCDGKQCESTLIPLNYTFVVPGGRFMEQYYWDSFWIIKGLIESELYDIVNATLQNFMDQIEHIGFIPNGGRIYFLNRSQPPLFIHMLSTYVEATNDTSILERALPLAKKELKWFEDNRSIKVVSPFSGQTRTVYRYVVTNSGPRPESYLTDYLTAHDPDLGPPLNEKQRADLYAELASGAETGWDYTARWLKDIKLGLRSLAVRDTIPVCLNSILYKSHLLLADLYARVPGSIIEQKYHEDSASALRLAILDLLWDPVKLAFYDYNINANARNSIFTAATFYPLWSGIIPDEVLSGPDKAFGFFASLNLAMNRYNGSFPSTFVETGLQWDAPNAWPPHQFIILEALRNLPSNITSKATPLPLPGRSTFSLIPPGQLGLDEDELPDQGIRERDSAPKTGSAADINTLPDSFSVINGGSGTAKEGWARALGRQLANRYFASAFCSWHATGGEISGMLPRLSNAELRLTNSVEDTGHMFEKFSNVDVASAGGGGEYIVQAGFGWTNGVVLWIASNYGDVLAKPSCPRPVLAVSPVRDSTVSTGAQCPMLLPLHHQSCICCLDEVDGN